ncbi:cobalamin-independent methionine synthase II family protein [Aquibium sp. LZ166]|uniref:Cobalamin-independent methionine synthase II family protein n=1 Tax=Aquibium pacificus TaxID=3153579 RepID=A0ABV3SD89_9HYPH
MKLSTDRILTTHTGSMPRGEPLSSMLIEQEEGKRVDLKKLDDVTDDRVAYIIKKQIEVGIDIANDGEQGRVGFQTYVPQRWSGFGGKSSRPFGREFVDFPKFTERMQARIPKTGRVFDAPEAIDEVHYHGTAQLQKEIDRIKRQAGSAAANVSNWFMNAPSPGIIASTMLNAYYDTDEAYLDAIAKEIAQEYKAVVDAGYILQVDAPDLAMERVLLYQDLTDEEFVEQTQKHVNALNKALENIPRESVRLHVCWGNWEGPHCYDVEMEVLLPIVYQAKVGAIGLEFANPRHQHETTALKANRPPEDMAIIPGVIDSKSNFVEHPQVVANRILAVVDAVGDRERVIAGVDCGFGTFTGWEWVAEDVVWAKLKSLREGAAIASKQLWG